MPYNTRQQQRRSQQCQQVNSVDSGLTSKNCNEHRQSMIQSSTISNVTNLNTINGKTQEENSIVNQQSVAKVVSLKLMDGMKYYIAIPRVNIDDYWHEVNQNQNQEISSIEQPDKKLLK